MALFGAPVGHEDHAQRACCAALSAQKAIAEYAERVRGLTKFVGRQRWKRLGTVDYAGHAYFQSATGHFRKGDCEKALALKEDVLRVMKGGFRLRNYVRALCVASWATRTGCSES